MKSDFFVKGLRLSAPVPEESYLSRVWAVEALAAAPVEITAPVTALVGENGAGKSTLLEAIALSMRFPVEGGTPNYLYDARDTTGGREAYMRVQKGMAIRRGGFFLRAESFYNTASYMEDEALGQMHHLSHGESFMELIKGFYGNSLFLLDEPESALSPGRQMELLCHMDRLVKQGAQFILATHSPMLMAFPGALVLEITPGAITPVNFRETAHYRITRRFLNDPEGMLKTLLGQ